MESFVTVTKTEKREIYEEIIPQIRSLVGDEIDLIANLANCAAVLKMAFPDISWVGFYLRQSNELVLGPFQGKPACIRIEIGRGVCGTAAKERRAIIVPDVSAFPGHIVCDPDSRSEIVLPVLRGGDVLGVLDLDSPALNSFDETDRGYLHQIVGLLLPKFRELGIDN